jgi:hypothetical protein
VRRPLAAVLAAAGLVAWLVALATLAVAPARADEPTEPTESTEPTEPTAENLTDAVLRWGVNTESNTAAHNPGTYNFLAAGRVPDPGRGGQQVPETQWQQRAGDVEVEKWDATAGVWKDATWAGLRTDSTGAALRIGSSSHHQLVFGRGVGTLDRTAGTARIAWQGSASVVFYSGFSFFSISDPVLEVAEGHGTVTATLSGFGSDQADPTRWVAVPPARVTIATLPEVTLGPDGFTVDPAYRGVSVDLAAGVQVRTGQHWGAFPQSWVGFMEPLGTGAFWYSSGAAADPTKVAAPLTVAFDASRLVVPAPTAATSAPPTVHNSAPPPPTTTATAAADPAPVAAAPVAVPPAVVPPAAVPPALEQPLLAAAATDLRPAAASIPAPDSPAARSWPWWGGGALLLLAAATLAVPPPVRGLR